MSETSSVPHHKAVEVKNVPSSDENSGGRRKRSSRVRRLADSVHRSVLRRRNTAKAMEDETFGDKRRRVMKKSVIYNQLNLRRKYSFMFAALEANWRWIFFSFLIVSNIHAKQTADSKQQQ